MAYQNRNNSYGRNRGYTHNKGHFSSGNDNKKPTTPYNFVTLNTRVVAPPVSAFCKECKNKNDMRAGLQEGYRQYLQDLEQNGKAYSGYFTVDIENLTPLFINSDMDHPSFFTNGEEICIAGSSLRGCLRHVFKIITESAMRVHHENPYAEYTVDGQRIDRDQDMTDQQLFFRAMASPKGVSTKDKYLERIATREAGILVKKGKNKNSNDDYYIYETTYEDIKDEDKANYNVPRIDWSEWHNGTGHVFLFSGHMPNKKRYYQLEAPNFDKARCYHVPEDVIIAYKNDKRRNEKSDLLAKFGTSDAMKMPVGQGLPCFFTLTYKQVESFGASLFYRLPYKSTMADRVPSAVRLSDQSVDFTDAVFGKNTYWRSRVFVEDSYLQTGEEATFEAEAESQTLLDPKPTSYQFYLQSQNGTARDWDDSTSIRGDKIYWHRQCPWQNMGKNNDNKNVNRSLKPLQSHHHFQGKVRFEDLSVIELGALASLFSLSSLATSQTSRDICYKIGMGKPIGLGSVRIQASLHLPKDEGWKTLFADGHFASGTEENDMAPFISAFHEYMKEQLQGNSRDWENYCQRMEELCTIMDFSWSTNKKLQEQVGYMDLTEGKNLIRNRVVLPTIAEIIDGLKK